MEKIKETLEKHYRFADKIAEVNWDARYRQDNEFLKALIPSIYSFIDTSIRKVIQNQNELRAVVTLSGGLDSSVTSIITAKTMQIAKNAGTAKNTSLVLLAFRGVSEEDLEYARKTANEISLTYSDIPIHYQEKDLVKLLRKVDKYTEEIVSSSKVQRLYVGGLATRLINTIGLEFGDKTGHCLINSTNGTEVMLGEFVIGCGAECSPIVDFYKSRVYDIAELIDVPKFVLNRNPINSTYGTDKISTYFGEIPTNLTPRDVYAVLDPVLYLVHNKGYKPLTIVKRLGHSKSFAENIYKKIKEQEHRRNVPFFGVVDRKASIKRTPKEISNEDIERFIEDGYGILMR